MEDALIGIAGKAIGGGALGIAFARVLWFLVNRWVKNVETKIEKLSEAQAETLKDVHAMQVSLAGLGIEEVKKTLKGLEEFRVEKTMECKALWRAIDPPHRRSDEDGVLHE